MEANLWQIQAVFKACEEKACICKTCVYDDWGLCMKEEGNCFEAQQLKRCPVANCDRYKARDDHGL
ncbi:MAG: hypothetical protein K6T65_13060 [Peptococcaceae bacterium]|jgi:hypothetical protein|nr:hypothetical protein [Peptococcaceae bacterium]